MRRTAAVAQDASPPLVCELQVGIDPPAVSADLLAPIPRPVALGKQFAASAPASASASAVADGRPGRPRRNGPAKAYKQHRLPGGPVRQTLSIWELLLPLLQPPIRIDSDCVDLPHRLYQYQVEGIEFLRACGTALLADEMGTGKTVMSTVALRLLFRSGDVRRALVVCPLSLLGVWDRHLADWAPELAVTVVHGDARTRWADWRCPAHVYVATYDTLRADLGAERQAEPLLPPSLAAGYDLVLLDEAQAIKNEQSARTRAVRSLRPRWRWALSGTPIENRLADLTSLFGFVRPGLLPAGGLEPEATAAAIAPFVKRRTKADVMRELPPKIRQDVWLELDEAQRRAYREAEDGGRRQLAALGTRVSRVHVFTVLTRLKMICNFAPGRTDGPKLDAVRELIAEVRAGGNKALVFSQWVGEGVDKLCRALAPYGVVSYDARLDRARREEAVRRFRTDPAAGVFVATVKSAGVGLTLTEASYVVHFDHWWNPAWMWQAEDRAHRRGQNAPVNVYSLWMQDTVEERVHAVLQRKGLLHEEVVGGLAEAAVDRLISVEEWLGLLGV